MLVLCSSQLDNVVATFMVQSPIEFERQLMSKLAKLVNNDDGTFCRRIFAMVMAREGSGTVFAHTRAAAYSN